MHDSDSANSGYTWPALVRDVFVLLQASFFVQVRCVLVCAQIIISDKRARGTEGEEAVENLQFPASVSYPIFPDSMKSQGV